MSPWMAGLLQAAGLTLYVFLFVSIVQNISNSFENQNPFVAMMSVLLAFVSSALICASITLIYPGILFFDNKKKEALQVILWNWLWLIISLAIIIGATLL